VYESPKYPSFIAIKHLRKAADACIDTTESLHANYSYNFAPELTNATKALDEVSALLNLYLENNSDSFATLITSKMPMELDDSFINVTENIASPNSPFGSVLTDELFHSQREEKKAHLELQIPVHGDSISVHGDTLSCSKVEPSSFSELNRGDSNFKQTLETFHHLQKSSGLQPNLTIDLLEVNLQRPNIVRRRVKNSSSIAKWIENNILSEFKKSKSSVMGSCKTLNRTSSSGEFNSYQSPLTESESTKLHSIRSKKDRILMSNMERRVKATCHLTSPQPLPSNSIDDFIRELKQTPQVYHVFEALCTKKFDKHTVTQDQEIQKRDNSQENTSENVESLLEVDDSDTEPKAVVKAVTPIKWKSTEEYLDHWWNNNGRFVVLKDEIEIDDQGYYGSADEDPDGKQSNLLLNSSFHTNCKFIFRSRLDRLVQSFTLIYCSPPVHSLL
jgi:hypothetical protein